MDSDDNGEIGRGRRANSSSSRESSPALKKQKRSFTPTSDDGDIVIPVVPDDDADTPPPDGASVPLIRQAVGFSWTPSTATTIDTYQATLPPKPVAHFLPGQAVPVSKKPGTKAKPKAPRKKKHEYGDGISSQTGRFRLTVPDKAPPPVPAPTPVPATYPGSGPYSSLYRIDAASPSASATISSGASVADITSPALGAHSLAVSGSHYASDYSSNMTSIYDNAAVGSSGSHPPSRSTTSIPPSTKGSKRTKKSSGKRSTRDPGPSNQHQPAPQLLESSQSTHPQPPSGPQHYRRDYERTSQQSMNDHSHSPSPRAHSHIPPSNHPPPPAPAPVPQRPLRMVTLLIEDMRSGVPDSQLAEVKVPLRVLNDPADGFWADAKDICGGLQASPSRIDGPAKVYTLRGKYRQFFMRVSADNVLEVESANLRVTTERTLEIVVEAPVPAGQLPPPPRLPPSITQASESESETPMSPYGESGSTFGPFGHDAEMERFPQVPHPSPNKRHPSPSSESTPRGGPYGHASHYSSSVHGSPSQAAKRSRHPKRSDHREGRGSYNSDAVHSHSHRQPHASGSSSRRSLSPPVMGRLADSPEERDDAITNYIRSAVENDPVWIQYMQSKAKPQRVSEVLFQYRFVQGKVQQLAGDTTPPYWDGAPNCRVEKEHVWRVLRLSPQWGAECQETLALVNFYGRNGTRYEDSRIVALMDSTEPPKEKAMKHFVKLLRSIDAGWVQDNTRAQDGVPPGRLAGPGVVIGEPSS
ncbi:hypothetical protein BV22DRAFT_1064026 [Leucogyrophana mollusca]|uniref:Uncharacterized protein n=1 Tax=Leucogyrophana mollusca TaxID=85980 RepID=A0ACB8BMZ9_9AGAM|nr:hypothetical protein BV22DRAFT_1064026 [Leucogyrophana mollusca]